MISDENPHPPPIPKSPGIYALMIQLPKGQTIQIGRLGRFHFLAGAYLYIGSALGPGGLAGRTEVAAAIYEIQAYDYANEHPVQNWLWPVD